jgi:hypothetical protein
VTALTADYDYVGVAADSSAQADRPLPGVPIGIPPWRYVAAGFSQASWSAGRRGDELPPSSLPPEERRDQAPAPVAAATGLRPRDADTLALVQSALRLSAHVLARDKSELTSQLVGRLGAYPTRE